MRSLGGRRWGSLILQSLALAFFCSGFFQWTPSVVPSKAMNENTGSGMSATMETARPIFDKLVFMVIDALRADFVYGDRLGREGFPWLRRQGGRRRDFIAMARAPTVTLPRIKALTAGTAPRFLDLLSNLQGEVASEEAGAALKDSSWVAQTSVLHYGDDTWMRLFPGLPGEGTHSFFVTDTVEVDHNVTRHLETALKRTDWTVLTLHYLGVDHIGHTGGITSPLMIPKLQEMDSVIRRVYEGLVERDARDGTKSVMIILGDHGMTDAGNHGGASPDELRTAAVFLSPHYWRERNNAGDDGERDPMVIDQVDIAPTVALLLGLEVPRGSTGQFISATLPPDTGKDQRRTLLLKNAIQLGRLLGQGPNLTDSASLDQVEAYIQAAAISLSANVGDYKNAHLILGILLMISSTLVAPLDWAALGLGLVYGATQFASTFLEEEHFFWHFSFTSLCLLAWWFCQDQGRGRGGWRYLLAALAHRMIYYWNSTGYLYQNDPDIRSILLKHPSAERILWLVSFVLAGLMFGLLDWAQRLSGLWARLMRLTRLVLLIPLVILGSLMKLGPLEQTLLERVVLFLLGLFMLTVLMGGGGRGRRKNDGYEVYSRGFALCLTFAILLKKHNALPMLIITIVSSFLLPSSLGVGPLDVGLSMSLLHSAYFLLGPCHLIPSIDFSPAYIGHTHYHPVLIPLVGYFVIWAGPLTVVGARDVPGQVAPLFRALVGTMLLISVALQRNHLFVWTVFAPRLVFELGWHVFYLLFSVAKVEG